MTGMDAASPTPPRAGRAAWGATVWPTAPRGWLALAAAAFCVGTWLVLPLLTTLRDRYPVTDTVVMPIIGLAVTAVAATVNVLIVWPGSQRSAVNIVVMGHMVAALAFLGFFVIGEGIGGG
ncbi:MAG: hypothetical protein Q7V58_08320 [Actinomycetota bacterium]|nr:hypothetical protein [Actinomycetota bacterium]